ncbi:MAG: sigma-70 family RNA polymerase sigma factor [Prevotella sp.]|nr:sigma-70 family RNA polymerase sigma factor [Prevotella sp.]
MTESELRGKEFLEYVAKNEKKLKKNLKKNITYDESIFDDCFQDTIIKVYNSIVLNNKDVKDYEKYFFIASKFNYINYDNKERKYRNLKIEIDDYTENEDIEDVTEDIYTVYDRLNDAKELIRNEFGEEKCDIYFDYMTLKSQGGMSYKEYSKLRNISFDKISNTISSIKSFIRKKRK